MKDERSKYRVKIDGLIRLIMWRYLHRPLGLILISEYPKSGGTWLGQMQAHATGLDFPRNRTPKFKKCIMHGHHLYDIRFGKVVGIIRDGRDVMISAYYHRLFENDRNSKLMVKEHRSKLNFENYEDIRTNLPRFIDYMFNIEAKRARHFSWSEAIYSYYKNELVYIVKYEGLLVHAKGELIGVFNFLNTEVTDKRISEAVKAFDFKQLTQRNQGDENTNSFLRKGVSGDWKNHFSKEACQVFEEFAGDALVLAGYESERYKWHLAE
jgi:hypothetical protein